MSCFVPELDIILSLVCKSGRCPTARVMPPADPACTAFLAVGPFPPYGPDCQLLTNTSEALPKALQIPVQQPTAAAAGVVSWPTVLLNVTSGDSLSLRSHGWLCFRGAELWDEFGTQTHRAIHQEAAAAGKDGKVDAREILQHQQGRYVMQAYL